MSFVRLFFERVLLFFSSFGDPGKRESAQTRDAEPSLHVSGAMLTDVGRVRQCNEDATLYVLPPPNSGETRFSALAVVADGMGGHAAGEIASALAAEAVRQVICSAAASQAPETTLSLAFERAHRAILDHGAAHPETQGMGTTCTAALIVGDQLYIGHIGDSRAYLLRDGALTQLSDDQTLHAQLIRDGMMTPEEASTAPGGNLILQALGARDIIAPSISRHSTPLADGDRIILCTDGLHGLASNDDILRIVSSVDPAAACQELIDFANASGGHDNISVGVFELSRTPRQAAAETATRANLKAAIEDPCA